MRRQIWPGCVLWVVLAAGAATAEPRRLAVVVGNNAGAPLRPTLRYSESDAARFARTLSEAGRFRPQDVHLVRGKPLAAVKKAFASVRAAVGHERRAGRRALVVFYYSGHADEEALELGGERLALTRLKALLRGTGADLRLGFVDACHSGALLEVGGRPAPAFSLHVSEELTAEGEVFVTSSAADEYALESSEAKGGVFTHHLVSGLRGAADLSGDRAISLDEAYRYSHARTVAATGSQHPAYGFRLHGSGEIVLASLAAAPATLELPPDTERALIADTEQVLAELVADSARIIAVPPGRYRIEAQRGGQPFAGRVEVAPGARERVHWADLAAVTRPVQSGGPRLAGILPLAGSAASLRVCAPPFLNRGDPSEGSYLSAALAATAAAALQGEGRGRPVSCRQPLTVDQLPTAPGPLPPSLRAQVADASADIAVLGSFVRRKGRVTVNVAVVHAPSGHVLEVVTVERSPPTLVDLQRELHRRLGTVSALLTPPEAP